MANAIKYQIVKGTDLQYLKAFQTLMGHPVGSQFSEVKLIYFLHGEKTVAVSAIDTDEDLRQLLSTNGQIFKDLQISQQNRVIQIVRKPDQIFDELNFNPGLNSNPIPPKDAALLFAHLQTVFPPVSGVNLGPLLGDDVNHHFAAREEALNRLAGMSEKILFDLADQKRKLDADYRSKEEELNARLLEKTNTIKAEFESKQAELLVREKALEAKKAELDDRSSTHARRDIRKELKAMIGQPDRLKVSKDARYRRAGIIGIYLLLMSAFGVPAVRFLNSSISSADFEPWTFGRQIAFSIGFVVTAGFFLRWLNQWSHQLAQEELRQKQFELDIDRASWLVEMALEWKAEKGTEIPEHLLQRLSHNLFEQKQNHAEVSMTAADALASAILGSASKAKVSLPGGELELDRRAINRLHGTET